MYALDSFIYKGYRVEIYRDDIAPNPLQDSLFGTLRVGEARRARDMFPAEFYDGDLVLHILKLCNEYDAEQEHYEKTAELVLAINDHRYTDDFYTAQDILQKDFETRLLTLVEQQIAYVLFDVNRHGRIALDDSPLSEGEGFDGIVYAFNQEVEEEFGPGEEGKQRAIKLMKSQLEEYGMYANGEVYGYAIFKPPADEDLEEGDEDTEWEDTEWEEVDSLWNIYGFTDAASTAKEEIDRWLGAELPLGLAA